MSLYDGPREVSDCIADLERRYGGMAFDRAKGELLGWKAERHLAQVRENDRDTNGADLPTRRLAWFLADRLFRRVGRREN